MPIAARQIARINAVPANSSGTNVSGKTTRSIASAAPAAATNAEPVQNRAASNDIGPDQAQREKIDDEHRPKRRDAQHREPGTRTSRLPCCLTTAKGLRL